MTVPYVSRNVVVVVVEGDDNVQVSTPSSKVGRLSFYHTLHDHDRSRLGQHADYISAHPMPAPGMTEPVSGFERYGQTTACPLPVRIPG